MRKVHNKLVRDRALERLNNAGYCATHHIVDQQEVPALLVEKLIEESIEVREAFEFNDREQLKAEIGDLSFALYCLYLRLGFTTREIEDEVCRKMRTCGRYDQGVFLHESWPRLHWKFSLGEAKYLNDKGDVLAEITFESGAWQIKGQPELPQGWDLERAKRTIESEFGAPAPSAK